MKTTLFIPVLNEIEGMKVVFPRIKREWVDEVLVVDGGSADGSLEYAQELDFTTLRQCSRGLLGAYLEGIEAAQGDVIIPFSPDGNSIPERIPDLIRKMQEGYDMVIASRYCDGAKSEDDTLATRLGNGLFTKMINLFFGARYTDTLVMFRAWRKEIYENLERAPTIAGLEPHLAIECAKRKLKVAEIPGDEPKRIYGRRKTNPFPAAWAILVLILQEFFTKRKGVYEELKGASQGKISNV